MKTHFGLSADQIKILAPRLYQAVATTYALYFNTLSCHWNLEDSNFISLHEMLQSQYEQLAENGDLLAERIRQMGEKVSASLRIFASKSKLADIQENASTAEMLAALAESHEQIILEFRALSTLAEEAKDYGLVDLLGGLLRDHEKTAWVLRSHLRS